MQRTFVFASTAHDTGEHLKEKEVIRFGSWAREELVS